MAYKPYISPKKSAKPSRLLALIALLIAFLLPYILIKLFRHIPIDSTQVALSLPQLEQTTTLPTPDTTAEAEEDDDADADEEEVVETKAEPPPEAKFKSEWQTITTRKGDTLARVFQRAGISSKTLQVILQKNPHAKILASIKPGQQLKILIRNKTLEQLIMPVSNIQFIEVTREGHSYKTQLNSRKMDGHNQYVTATIKGSLYNTAKRMNIPYKLMQQMTEIFRWEVDFAREIRAGDRITMVYQGYFIDNKLVSTGEIIAVSYTSRGKIHQAVRHMHANGDYDYFTAQGASLKKAFTRYPIKFSHISSTFSLSRKHPILHYNRPHKGVDLAAPIGTPVHATGDGRIAMIGRENGYGNMVKITHWDSFSSIYGHMLKFQKGLSKGTHIKRGQIIGYVGQTGLATGPHCHYEFHINKNPKNPTTVDLPKAPSIPAREMASFKAKANNLFAQMKLYEQGKS